MGALLRAAPALATAQPQRSHFPLAFRACPLAGSRRQGLLRRYTTVVCATGAEPGTSEKPQVPAAGPSKEGSSDNGAASGGSSGGGSSSSSAARSTGTASSLGAGYSEDDNFSWDEFIKSDLPKKLGGLLALIALSRVGVYIRLPGVDVDAFSDSLTNSGLMGYLDTLSGGSISKVGLFSLGIIPYINSSIVLQLFSAAFPSLKKMQREDGAQGRAKFQYYQKLAAFVFAIVQAIGQLTYIRPFVEDFSLEWLAGSTCALVAGAMALVYIADTISELKLGNGTSVLIFANIASALPASVGQLVSQNTTDDPTNIAIFLVSFVATTLGIIYVQEAERRIPMNYSNRFTSGNLARQSYLPFKVNATGVMPSSLRRRCWPCPPPWHATRTAAPWRAWPPPWGLGGRCTCPSTSPSSSFSTTTTPFCSSSPRTWLSS